MFLEKFKNLRTYVLQQLLAVEAEPHSLVTTKAAQSLSTATSQRLNGSDCEHDRGPGYRSGLTLAELETHWHPKLALRSEAHLALTDRRLSRLV